MKNARSCLLWLALYFLLALAVAFAVERRVGRNGPALFGAAIAGFVAWLGVTHLTNFGRKAGELWLIRKGMAGEEPRDGERFAAIGPISPIGSSRLVSPLTRTPAVAYTYLISRALVGGQKWDGVALIPASIRCGAHSVRLLALPELDITSDRLTGEAVVRHGEEYIRQTEFPKETSKDDGTARKDHGPRVESPTLRGGFFFEKVVKPGDVVCAIGRYSVARGGLHEVRLESGEPGRMMFKRIRAIGGSLMNAVIMIALVAAALTALYAFVPLNVARPSWLEIRLEDLLDERVRQPIARADLFPMPLVEPATSLNMFEARGRIRTAAGEANVTAAKAERIDGGIRILLYDGEREVAVLTVSPVGELRGLKLLNEEIAPSAAFTFRQLGGEVVGRVSWMKSEIPAIHAIFRTTVKGKPQPKALRAC